MNNNLLMKSVQSINTVGPRRAASLQRIGIFTVGDLLYHFPRRYEDRTRLSPAGACAQGGIATVRGTVLVSQDLNQGRVWLLPNWPYMTFRSILCCLV